MAATPNALLLKYRCYDCLTDDQLQALTTVLLFQWLENGLPYPSTGANFIIDQGGGAILGEGGELILGE